MQPVCQVAAIATAALFSFGIADAQQSHPTFGMLMSVEQKESLQYDCKLNPSAELECELVRTVITKNKIPEDWEEQLMELDKNFLRNKQSWEGTNVHEDQVESDSLNAVRQRLVQRGPEAEPSNNESIFEGATTVPPPTRAFTDAERSKACTAVAQFINIYSGNAAPPILPAKDAKEWTEFLKRPQEEQEDTLRMIRAIDSLCNDFTKDNLITFAKNIHEQESRTCKIHVTVEEKSFSKHGDNSWVSVVDTESECRWLILERFEKSDTDSFTFWNFYRRETVANPNLKPPYLGKTCAEMVKDKEADKEYHWNTRSVYLGCDYIDIGTFVDRR